MEVLDSNINPEIAITETQTTQRVPQHPGPEAVTPKQRRQHQHRRQRRLNLTTTTTTLSQQHPRTT